MALLNSQHRTGCLADYFLCDAADDGASQGRMPACSDHNQIKSFGAFRNDFHGGVSHDRLFRDCHTFGVDVFYVDSIT